ncbi:hypothetical protein TrCOL_g21 [Triparma columacea]|uniref:Uncharacterized protein n=1 Tax=Triparma columacea TaxID=722753 RepID=A0A9W7FXI3_9STRA|nr:hypothetical protein TrCOL_g21 [Triparma columacea]
MMTGNTMKFLDAFLNGRINDALFFASLVGIYTVATAGYKIVSNGVEKRGEMGGRVRMSTPRLLSPIVLFLFLLSDHMYPSPRPTLRLLSFAFGLINACSIESAGTITCMLTGHMHKLANAFVEDGKITNTKILRRSLAVLGGFCIGAGLAVLGEGWVPGYFRRGIRSTLGGMYFVIMAVMNDKGGVDTNVLGRRECVIDEYDAGCKE